MFWFALPWDAAPSRLEHADAVETAGYFFPLALLAFGLLACLAGYFAPGGPAQTWRHLRGLWRERWHAPRPVICWFLAAAGYNAYTLLGS